MKSSTSSDVRLLSADAEAAEVRRRSRRGLTAFWVLAVLGAVLGYLIASLFGNALLGAGIGALAGAAVGTVASAVLNVWPVLRAVWHWLAEIVGLLGVVLAARGLAALWGSWWWSLLLLLPVAVALAIRPVRRHLVGWVTCAVVRHRLRVCFAEFIRDHNAVTRGLLPFILVAKATPAGERVWVWLRTGLDVADLEARRGKIAVTCHAADVQLTGSRRFAALVRLDVTRRDPLRPVVSSPVVATIPNRRTTLAAVAGGPAVGMDLVDVPEEPSSPAPVRRVRAA